MEMSRDGGEGLAGVSEDVTRLQQSLARPGQSILRAKHVSTSPGCGEDGQPPGLGGYHRLDSVSQWSGLSRPCPGLSRGPEDGAVLSRPQPRPSEQDGPVPASAADRRTGGSCPGLCRGQAPHCRLSGL